MNLLDGKKVWTELKDYGKRWHVEIWFSAYKRRFGEKIKATSWKGTIKEILNNIHTLNLIYKKKKQTTRLLLNQNRERPKFNTHPFTHTYPATPPLPTYLTTFQNPTTQHPLLLSPS